MKKPPELYDRSPLAGLYERQKHMDEHVDYENIFTPQGMLGDVSKHPNLDFLMNIFNIPRVYSVSGFGTWNVGQHTVAVAFLTLYWSAYNAYAPEKRDRLVTLALMHDVHEAVIGDILPYFKTAAVKEAIDAIQNDILHAFAIEEEQTLHDELKLLDMIGFLYEIGQSSPRGIDPAQRKLIKQMYARQKDEILGYAGKVGFDQKNVNAFLASMKL
ncbi:MAG TPA: HD domain-containing protein [Ktedonobacteraceae bacterium]|nr:HD domain-containing protein [Ktedonobacteraceae bacterium]